MRWFSTAEVCEILGRFERIYIIGDSIMRNIVGAMHMLLREDLGYGGARDWTMNATDVEERCFCFKQFSVPCFGRNVENTTEVVQNDPKGIACPADRVNLKCIRNHPSSSYALTFKTN
jgi:hypothetical protein